MHCILVITKIIKVKLKICFIADKIGDIKGINPYQYINMKMQNGKFKTYNKVRVERPEIFNDILRLL